MPVTKLSLLEVETGKKILEFFSSLMTLTIWIFRFLNYASLFSQFLRDRSFQFVDLLTVTNRFSINRSLIFLRDKLILYSIYRLVEKNT